MNKDAIKTTLTRPHAPELDQILGQPFPVLDHGFVRVVDYMGDDSAVVQAARVSYGTGTKKVNEDQGLINYLMRHRHSTPFEMCEIKLHVKLPIFVARQWIRHRTANVNEYSARYSILDREFYIPAPDVLAQQSTLNNQGRETPLAPEEAQKVLDVLRDESIKAYQDYEYLLEGRGDHPGIARELARMVLPLNYYTQWYWKIDLHNLLHFLTLRADPHAQHEIRVYAQTILELVKLWVPLTYKAFCEYRLESASFSKYELEVIKRWIQGDIVTAAESGLSARQWRELHHRLGKELPS